MDADRVSSESERGDSATLSTLFCVHNRPFAGRLVRDYAEPHPLARGEELGRFENGSTVILLFEKGAFRFDEALHEGQKILLGEAIGRFTEKKKGT